MLGKSDLFGKKALINAVDGCSYIYRTLIFADFANGSLSLKKKNCIVCLKKLK